MQGLHVSKPHGGGALPIGGKLRQRALAAEDGSQFLHVSDPSSSSAGKRIRAAVGKPDGQDDKRPRVAEPAFSKAAFDAAHRAAASASQVAGHTPPLQKPPPTWAAAEVRQVSLSAKAPPPSRACAPVISPSNKALPKSAASGILASLQRSPAKKVSEPEASSQKDAEQVEAEQVEAEQRTREMKFFSDFFRQ
ncbi:unnamed protein product, partial [Polarella glacialis]